MVLQTVDATTLRVTWQQPQQQNGVIANYRLVLQSLEPHSVGNSTETTTREEFTWTDLHPYYSYTLNISAATAAGYGPSTERQFQMPEAGTYRANVKALWYNY